MTAVTGLKRLGIALLALAGGGAVAATVASYLVSPETVRHRALDEIRAVTGLEPRFDGAVSVALFPNGTVTFADVTLGDTAHPALKAERLTARLRFFSLLTGRVELADISLEKPTIAVDIDEAGSTNWAGLLAALARTQKPGARRASAFSEMRINDGIVRVRQPGRDVTETLYDVDLSLAWPSISKSFGATGRFIWHDERVDASLTIADFGAALSGNRSGFRVRLAGPPMKAAFEGAVSLDPTLRIEGTLAADAASLRNAMIWAGQKPMPGGGFGRFAIKAQTVVNGGTISLSGVNVDLDGNTAEGVLTFATDGRKTLQGTLAAETLNVTPYVSTLKLLTGNARVWDTSRIGLDGLASIDLDLRLSAANVIMANASIGRTAIATNLRGGHLVITVGEAVAYNGLIKGTIALSGFDTGVDVKSQLQFADVDLDTCLGQLFGLKRIEGKGTINVAIEGTGDSVMGVTRTLNGTATLTGSNGALTGLDIEQLLRRLERRPLSGGGEFRTGRTPFDKLTVGLKITQGVVAVDDMKVDGTTVRIALAGQASIPSRDLDLKGTAALTTSARAGNAPFELPFIVQGSWDDPMMLPDPEALIRRSGAAAPLLNAVRDRSTRDQVRSVIERLTGAPSATLPTPAADQTAGPAQKPE